MHHLLNIEYEVTIHYLREREDNPAKGVLFLTDQKLILIRLPSLLSGTISQRLRSEFDRFLVIFDYSFHEIKNIGISNARDPFVYIIDQKNRSTHLYFYEDQKSWEILIRKRIPSNH